MDWLKLAGVIVASLALLAGLYYFLAGRRRNKIHITFSAQSVISSNVAHHDLELRHNGTLVQNPYAVLLVIQNLGPKDVRSNDFDGDASLQIDLGMPILSVSASWSSPRTAKSVSTSPKAGTTTSVEFPPGLMRKGDQCTASVIVDGKPKPEVRSPIADTDVTLDDRAAPPVFRALTVAFTAAGSAFTASALAAGAISAAGLPSFGVALVGGGAFMVATGVSVAALYFAVDRR
ncbi:hypothetical protein [Nocardia altamirensis]|uniref:hypothetical protein n=1 Tax=Nocardia altamirensis TaxID=472158 RepID=UPI00114C9538|nr:hypothetical protein [Nocardia altamirensis]